MLLIGKEKAALGRSREFQHDNQGQAVNQRGRQRDDFRRARVMTPSPVSDGWSPMDSIGVPKSDPPRLVKAPVAVHAPRLLGSDGPHRGPAIGLPQGGEGCEFPRSPLETGWLGRQRDKEPPLPRIASACAAPHSQPDNICFGHEWSRFTPRQNATLALRWGLPNFEAGGSQGNTAEFEYQAEQPTLLEVRRRAGAVLSGT